MENSLFYSWYGLLLLSCVVMSLGLCAILMYRNLIKIFIGIEIASKGIVILFLAAGSANGKLMLAQSLLVTYIIIEAVVATVVLGLITHIYHEYGTLDIRTLTKLRG
jgi:NADH:ubiquinone oxidoreductase subunit K